MWCLFSWKGQKDIIWKRSNLCIKRLQKSKPMSGVHCINNYHDWNNITISIYWLLFVQYSTRTYLYALHHSKVKLEKHFLCKSVMLFGDYLTIASDPSFCKDVGNRMSLTVTDVILVGRDIFCLFVVQKGAGIQQPVWVRVFLGHM